MTPLPERRCTQSEVACAYALRALPASEVAAAETDIAACPDCQRELESLRPVVDRFVSWPTDILRPHASLQARLAQRIAKETGTPPVPRWSEPDWKQVGPGIECKPLATDTDRHRVSMPCQYAGALGPRPCYPAHVEVEELHLLDGELWIDKRKLCPGDHSYGAAGAGRANVRGVIYDRWPR